MALRDQPYIPLYVQDVLTDEKLIECSAESHGVYFRLLCILHKQETYGLLCMKQKYKQSTDIVSCFADMLSKQLPFKEDLIDKCLRELISENVLTLNGDSLYQKRMLRDGKLSLLRADIGKKGGSMITRQYGKRGYMYLMSDRDHKHKIGISTNPQNRLYRLRSDLKLPKHFDIIDSFIVDDMGMTEENAHIYFGTLMNGEWVDSDFQTALNTFALFKANNQANVQANAENENANENEDEFASEFDLPIRENSENFEN